MCARTADVASPVHRSLVFGGLFHNPGSGLAGVLFAVVLMSSDRLPAVGFTVNIRLHTLQRADITAPDAILMYCRDRSVFMPQVSLSLGCCATPC